MVATREVKNLGLWMTPDDDVFEIRDSFEMALDGGAYREGPGVAGISMGSCQLHEHASAS